MIEIVTSRSGQPVLKQDGRLLASSFDPVKEAFAWAKRAAVDIGNKGAAIIIGGGCGYHVAALKELCPTTQIIALDPNAEVIAKALSWNPVLSERNFVIAHDPMALTEAPLLCDAMAGPYAILPHLPTAESNPAWALATAKFLLGRDKLSFLLQLRMRPELHALLDPKKIAQLGDEPISIKTLQRLFAETSANSRERQIWRALEELVL